ncbi:hypothetical protein KM043_003428 [Ampulex compressa]|nr:hypothetical protein KM043_003428 [Ampulex compressa]
MTPPPPGRGTAGNHPPSEIVVSARACTGILRSIPHFPRNTDETINLFEDTDTSTREEGTGMKVEPGVGEEKRAKSNRAHCSISRRMRAWSTLSCPGVEGSFES